MNAQLASQVVLDLSLYPVNDIVNGRKVPVTVHFGVQGGKQPARAVVMDN